jgi:uncharacterized protein
MLSPALPHPRRRPSYQQVRMSSSALLDAIAPIHALVAASFTSHDPSHDMHHIMRVCRTAVALAKAEGLGADDVALTHIAALLHDACDPKYFKDSAVLDRALQLGAAFGLTREQQATVQHVAKNISFTQELAQQQQQQQQQHDAIFCCVQDADRLDAMGAVGIARTFSFGAVKSRPFYDPLIAPIANPTPEQYNTLCKTSPTINHFTEKLLQLRGMLKTASGRALGEQRHAFMLQFLAQFMAEVDADATLHVA